MPGWTFCIADRRPETTAIDELTMQHALGVGAAEALALMPGVSRSGITITAGRFLGLGRDAAARFSFLISTPIVLGAVLYRLAVAALILSLIATGARDATL